MKFTIIFALIGLTAISVCTAGSVAKREKRSILGCTSKIPETVKKCSKALDDELDLDKKVQEEIKEDTPGEFKCCYMAKFNYCLRSELEDECGNFATTATSLLDGTAKALAPKCEGYNYPSVTCIFFVWFYYIVAAIVIIFLLSLGCCIARCICGRK